MTLDTIYVHLTKLVQNGFIKVESIIAADRIEIIAKAIDYLEDGVGLAGIKEALGDTFSYGEIRLVRAATEHLD